MTLLLMEGFEAKESKLPYYYAQYITSQPGRFGGFSAEWIGGSVFNLTNPLDTVIWGAAVRKTDTSARDLVEFYSANGAQGRLQIAANGAISLIRGGGTYLIQGTVGNIVNQNIWCYVEVKFRALDVGGVFQVRVNGTEVLSFVGDTMQSTGLNPITRIQCFSSFWYDDMYICDDKGAEHNDFLGDVQIETLVPNANGSFSQLQGSDGNKVDNYLLVDELPASETDHVASAVVGERDTYQFTNLVIANGQILAVQPVVAASKGNAGPAFARVVTRLANGAEHESEILGVSNLAWLAPPPLARDPEGAVWTPASVNSAEFGIEVA